jgi:hypothetical protein
MNSFPSSCNAIGITRRPTHIGSTTSTIDTMHFQETRNTRFIQTHSCRLTHLHARTMHPNVSTYLSQIFDLQCPSCRRHTLQVPAEVQVLTLGQKIKIFEKNKWSILDTIGHEATLCGSVLCLTCNGLERTGRY